MALSIRIIKLHPLSTLGFSRQFSELALRFLALRISFNIKEGEIRLILLISAQTLHFHLALFVFSLILWRLYLIASYIQLINLLQNSPFPWRRSFSLVIIILIMFCSTNRIDYLIISPVIPGASFFASGLSFLFTGAQVITEFIEFMVSSVNIGEIIIQS